jgi:nickel-dependent lactate racemase
VVASAGGHPRDVNFIQSHKALEAAFHAVKPGGTLVVAAKCADGFGHKDFLGWFRHETLEAFYEVLGKHYQVYGQTAYATLWKAKKANFVLVSSLPAEDVKEMSITPAADLAEAAKLVQARHGGDFSACVMPYAGDTLIADEKMSL